MIISSNAATAAKPQTQCTPDACPSCMLPKICDCETNLNAVIEAADQFAAAIQSLDEIFGQFGHCGIREHIDHESFSPKRYIGIQVMKRELLDLVPGELKYIPWVDEEVAYQVQRVISPNVRVTYLVKRWEVQHGEVQGMGLSNVEKEVIINE